jgi:uroporphyrinogen decarboxylase
MEAAIQAGIDAKHSNEDQIAPFRYWIDHYNDRIGLFGGIDVDVICRGEPRAVYEDVLRQATEYRAVARGYALGSGNSIPAYVPTGGYLAMIEAAKEVRRREAGREK